MSPVELTVPIPSEIPLSLTSSSMFGVAVGMEVMAMEMMEIEMEVEVGPPAPPLPCRVGEDVFSELFLPFSPLSVSTSVSDASGNLVIQEIAIRPLTQDMLQHEVRCSRAVPIFLGNFNSSAHPSAF